MPSLADHYSENEWLPDGEYDTTVKFVDIANNPLSGTRGPKYQFTDDEGRKVERSFLLSDNNVWTLAKFAGHCGMTKEEMAKFDHTNDNHFRKLDGRRVRVTVGRDKKHNKYADVIKTAPVNPDVPAKGEAPRRESAPYHSGGGGYGHDGYGAQPQHAGGFNPTEPQAGALPPDDDLPF